MIRRRSSGRSSASYATRRYTGKRLRHLYVCHTFAGVRTPPAGLSLRSGDQRWRTDVRYLDLTHAYTWFER